MNKFVNIVNTSILSFAREEDGSQVVEYALIIAVVSVALVIALRGLVTDTSFTDFITRVSNCLSGNCTAP